MKTALANLFAPDHKTIGKLFLFSSLAYLGIGGMLAMAMRWQLMFPNDPAHPLPLVANWLGWSSGIMPPEWYAQLLTLHGTVMIFFTIIPMLSGAFGQYLVPLKIGARGMAMPRLSGVSFWLSLPAGVILLVGLMLPGGSAATGWTAYAPLSSINFNGGGGHAEISGVFAWMHWPGGSWPTAAILIVFLAWGGTFFYVVTNLTRRIVLAVTLAPLAAYLATLLTQAIAFDGQNCWFFALLLNGIANIIGAICLMTTVALSRCRGMHLFRMPLTVWTVFLTAILVALATPALAGLLVMNILEHFTIRDGGATYRLASFFVPAGWTYGDQLQSAAGGGFAALYEHLFWFYSHPAVYIMILPAMGIVSDIMPVFCRKPLFGYRAMVWANVAIITLGFFVWAHHLFQSGLNPTLGTAFAAATMLIAVPSGVKTFNWMATMWRGSIQLTVPMLHAMAFVSLFVIGGLSGIFMASSAVDVHVHGTYFVVAHIHYVLFGGSLFGIFAGLTFWFPKMFGRMMNRSLGYTHFFITFLAFNHTFFTMHILGLAGMPRRVADYTQYDAFANLLHLNRVVSVGAFVLGAAQLIFVVNFFSSMIWGKRATSNPWNSTTLEWETTSPPSAENYAILPVVHHGPYEYSSPLSKEDWLPQTRYIDPTARPAPADALL